MEQKNTKIIGAIVGVVLVVVAFFAGKAYGATHSTKSARAGYAMNAQGRIGQNGTGMMGGRAGFAGTMGQVISKDATSITLSLQGGGSKIVLYSPTTTVAKSTTGSIDDVTVGSTVSVTGSTNTDGSVTATAIQMRPAGATTPTVPKQ